MRYRHADSDRFAIQFRDTQLLLADQSDIVVLEAGTLQIGQVIIGRDPQRDPDNWITERCWVKQFELVCLAGDFDGKRSKEIDVVTVP